MKYIKYAAILLILAFSPICLAEINPIEIKESSGQIETEMVNEAGGPVRYEWMAVRMHYKSFDGTRRECIDPAHCEFVEFYPGERKIIPPKKGYYVYIIDMTPISRDKQHHDFHFLDTCNNLAPIMEGKKKGLIYIQNKSFSFSSRCWVGGTS